MIVLDNRPAFLRSGSNDLQGGEALYAHATTELLVVVIVTVDGGDFSETFEALGSFLVSWLQVLAVTAPGGVELDDLKEE